MRVTKKYPYRNGWRVAHYPEGESRKFRFFDREIDADEFVRNQQLLADASTFAVTEEERFLIHQLRRAALKANVNLADCTGDLVKTLERKAVQSETTVKAFAAYLEHCRTHGARPKTLEQYETYGMEFARAHPKQMDQVTREEVLTWILTRYSNDNSRGFVRTAIVSCMRWAEQEKQWCNGWSKPLRWAKKRTDEREITIFTPQQFAALLGNAAPHVRSAFALMGFAGIRPQELTGWKKDNVLQWEHIDRKKRVITIPGAVAKTRRLRTLTDLPESLWKWLALDETETGPVVAISERNFRHHRSKLLPALGLDTWPQDVLRHSFGTYGFYHLGMDRTIDLMGHAGFKTFFRHYKSHGSEAAAREWFGIIPK